MRVRDLRPAQEVAILVTETTEYYREPTVFDLIEAADLTDTQAAELTLDELVEKARDIGKGGFQEWMERRGEVQGQDWTVWLADKEAPTPRTPEEIAEGMMTSFHIVDGDVEECSADYIATIIEEAVKEARA